MLLWLTLYPLSMSVLPFKLSVWGAHVVMHGNSQGFCASIIFKLHEIMMTSIFTDLFVSFMA